MSTTPTEHTTDPELSPEQIAALLRLGRLYLQAFHALKPALRQAFSILAPATREVLAEHPELRTLMAGREASRVARHVRLRNGDTLEVAHGDQCVVLQHPDGALVLTSVEARRLAAALNSQAAASERPS